MKKDLRSSPHTYRKSDYEKDTKKMNEMIIVGLTILILIISIALIFLKDAA